MEYKSLWLKDMDENNYNELDKNLNLDILIIGGGITGLTTLYKLRKSKLNIALVEANLIGSGVSGHTTGKINYLQGLTYQKITKKYSLEVARLYYESQKDAIKFITGTIAKEKIDCDLKVVDSYIATNKEEDVSKIKLEAKILKSFGCNVKEVKENNLPIKSKCQIKVSDTYVFHPYKYLQALKNVCLQYQKLIYEKTKIIDLKKVNNHYVCYTDNYKITTKKVILACHYPFFLFPYFMPIKAKIEKSYIAVVKDNNKNYTLITTDKSPISLRFHQDNLIYLSNSSYINKNLDDTSNFKSILETLKKSKLMPELMWKNMDLLTIDNLPYIGKIKQKDNNLLIGTGYNTWGMTNGSLAGLILSDLVLGNNNKYANMCNPLRINWFLNFKDYVINLWESMYGYMVSKISKNKKWYPQNVRYEKINQENIAIYKDGKKTYKIYNRCPHMGCSLIFNAQEKTWDCPCHASRFNLKGECIKGPSTYNITYKD